MRLAEPAKMITFNRVLFSRSHPGCIRARLLFAPHGRSFLLGLCQQVMYFLFAGLREIFVPVAHSIEWLRRLRADDFIQLGPQLRTGRRGSYRYGDDDTGGL